MKKKKIVFLSSCVRGGGAGWSLFYLVKYIDRKIFEPIVVVPDAGIFKERYSGLGVRVVVAPHLPERTALQHFKRINFITKTLSLIINTAGMIRTVFWLKSFMKKEKVDLVYANNMLVKSIGALAGKFSKKPCVLHIRNLHEKKMEAFFYRRIFKLSSVKLIFSNSAASAVPFKDSVSDKIRIVHNGVDVEEYSNIKTGVLRKEAGLSKKIIVGYTGNIIPRKGLDILIKSMAEILRSNEDVVLLIVGRVPIGSSTDHQSIYQRLAEEKGVLDRVIFLGFRKDVRPYVQDMDILVLPSRQEPFGRSIVEAMALGVPVVASRVGGIPEIITDAQDGFLFPVEDTDKLSSTLSMLIGDKKMRKAIGRNARATINSRFNVEILSKEIQKSILELLDMNGK